jgi:hypothetical protein
MVVAKALPQAERDHRQLQATAATAAIEHAFIASLRRGIDRKREFRMEGHTAPRSRRVLSK